MFYDYVNLRNIKLNHWFLIWKIFCPLGDIWQHPERFLVVTTGKSGAAGMEWEKDRDAAKQLTVPRMVPQ